MVMQWVRSLLALTTVRLAVIDSGATSSADAKSSSQQPQSQSQQKPPVWGPEVFALVCQLVCALINNQASCLKSLHGGGVTDAFLSHLSPVRLAAVALLLAVDCSLAGAS